MADSDQGFDDILARIGLLLRFPGTLSQASELHCMRLDLFQYIPSYASALGYSRTRGTIALSVFNLAAVVGSFHSSLRLYATPNHAYRSSPVWVLLRSASFHWSHGLLRGCIRRARLLPLGVRAYFDHCLCLHRRLRFHRKPFRTEEPTRVCPY